MPTHSQALVAILLANPDAVAAHYDDPEHPRKIIVHVQPDTPKPTPGTYATHPARGLHLPQGTPRLPIEIKHSQPLSDLRTRDLQPIADNCHTCCQDEPIKLGCQIQPAGANWLGTAGAPVKWKDADGALHWGFLSNRHVLVPDSPRARHPQHQPTTALPPVAFLAGFSRISSTATNYVDAAIADAYADGKHTISHEVLEIGPLGPLPINADVGLRVAKSGRTSGLTYATCTAIGAAARVSYGSFIAVFADQDMYAGDGGVFSVPGDSGSMIVTRSNRAPTSLLFAGGGNLTIGNPMRFVSSLFNLVWPFS